MKLIIAEKSSVGYAYAHALGVNGKNDGYIECNDPNRADKYIITWCVGHLVELANTELYNERYKKWNIADLPIIPQDWQYIVSADKNKQFGIVKTLMNDKRVTEIICGTDAGREGELIFRLVYEKADCKKPVKRLWLSSMEEKAIINGFNNLREGAEYDNLYQSALCRSKADWLIGINATRIYTKLYNKMLNVGRVQTPTLAMIYERGEAIKNFVKEKYFNVRINDLAVSENLKSESEAERIKSACNGKTAVVTAVKRERKTVNPPKLYDLTTLQREANRQYGFTAQQTLDYAQSLYEMKLITYPRTDSQYITDDMAGTAEKIISIIIGNIEEYKGLSYNPNIARIALSKKVTDHHAIIPTAELENSDISGLPIGERKILFLIIDRLICATAGNHEYEAVTAEIECKTEAAPSNFIFTARGKTVISDGWKGIGRIVIERDGDEADNTPIDLHENQSIAPVTCIVSEHYTSPPKQFTEDTLLSAMQKAGAAEITEEVERSGVPLCNRNYKVGLGTPATRASIIEKLIKSGFVKRDKKNIIATDEGAELAVLMPDFLKSAKLTADWENGLALISQGKLSAEKFMSEIEALTAEIVTNAKENVDQSKVVKYEGGEIIGKCMRCNGDVRETPKAYSCQCGFALWKNNKFFESAKKPFTKEIATALLKDGKTEVQGLCSPKTGRMYNAVVSLVDTGTYVNLKLSFPKGGK